MEPVRRIEHTYRVRFDEADADGWLRASGLLRYAQDMAWRHSEEAGFGREWYAERGMQWLVRNVTLAIRARVTYGDVLAVATEVTGWRHVWARRRTEIVRTGSSAGDGHATRPAPVATIDTDWVLLTTEGRPARVPAVIADYFARVGPFTRDRVALPEPSSGVTRHEARVRPLDVDPMRHMNNAAYVDMIDHGLAHLPHGQQLQEPRRYRIGYLRPALPGSRVSIECWTVRDGEAACRIRDRAGDDLSRALVHGTRQ